MKVKCNFRKQGQISEWPLPEESFQSENFSFRSIIAANQLGCSNSNNMACKFNSKHENSTGFRLFAVHFLTTRSFKTSFLRPLKRKQNPSKMQFSSFLTEPALHYKKETIMYKSFLTMFCFLGPHEKKKAKHQRPTTKDALWQNATVWRLSHRGPCITCVTKCLEAFKGLFESPGHTGV